MGHEMPQHDDKPIRLASRATRPNEQGIIEQWRDIVVGHGRSITDESVLKRRG